MKKIMIVDDHAGILRLLSIEIQQKGYQVITAVNGEEALVKIDAEQPDLVLLDIIMPVMNGFDVLSRLRRRSNVPVIIHSFDEQNREMALKLGADDFFLKPYDIDKLIEKMDKVFNRRLVKENNGL